MRTVFLTLTLLALTLGDETCPASDPSCAAAPPAAPVSVIFANDGARDLDVFWLNVPLGAAAAERHWLAVVPAGGATSMNTFESHTFSVVEVGSWQGSGDTFTIAPGRTEYRFGSADTDDAVKKARRLGKEDLSDKEWMALQKRESEQRASTLRTFRQAVPVKFRNLSNRTILLWYDNGQGVGVRQNVMLAGADATTNSYAGHQFCVTEAGSRRGCLEAQHRLKVQPGQYTYLFDDGSASVAEQRRWADEVAFSRQYREQTGRDWVRFFPSPKPKLPFWDADFIGQEHHVTTPQAHFHCVPPRTSSTWRYDPRDASVQRCQHADPLNLTLKAVSATPGPRIFTIDGFLSEAEADHVVGQGAPKVQRSKTGQADSAFESSTRTSRTSWVERHASPILDNIFRRAADVLKMDEALLHPHRNAELLQVVHYSPDQKYDAHHDWGVDNGPATRFATLLLYLNDPELGGQTAFPKTSGSDGEPLALHPGKGSAVLFYNLLPDGNADDLTLHTALPVVRGEKWLANFWIWDPHLAM